MYGFLKNKNAMLWAFDEVIDNNTVFEGNTFEKSKNETKDILFNFIKKNKHFSEVITNKILKVFFDTINKGKILNDSLKISKEDTFIFGGWRGHGISLFYEKDKKYNDIYKFGIINAGEGSEIHGYKNEICNGILIFKDIKYMNIVNFFNDYKKFFYLEKELSNDIYHIVYYLIWKHILEKSGTNVNFGEISEEKIVKIETDMQTLGSCTFTNIINYIIYILYKNNSNNKDIYSNFREWYYDIKKKLKNKICQEIYDSEKY